MKRAALHYTPAEVTGFEPAVPLGTFAFQANALSRSATLPIMLFTSPMAPSQARRLHKA